MDTLYARKTNFQSPLLTYRDYALTIEGFPVTIEFSYHGYSRSREREVFDAGLVYMIQQKFDQILDLKNNQNFIIIDTELCISMVGQITSMGGDLVITVVSAIDSDKPINSRNTVEFVI